MKFSALVHNLDVPANHAWDIHYEALDRQRAGENIIVLSIGDHEFDTPAPIVDAVKQSLDNGRHHYTPAAGEPHFREAVAGFHHQLTGQTVHTDEILAVPGAQCGLYVASVALLEKGDEVLVPDPMYSTYADTINSSGAQVVPVPLDAQNGFALPVDKLRAAVTRHTRAVLLNYPHNPTGTIMDKQTLEAIAAFCEEFDLWVISDEVYASVVFDGEHLSPVSVESLRKRTMVISSLSKSHAMTGWRIGWLIGPREAIKHCEHLCNCILYGIAPFVQDAATAAIKTYPLDNALATNIYRPRRDLVASRLSNMPRIRYHTPTAGMYFMLDIRDSGMTSAQFARNLLETSGVALLPGEAFGEGGRGFVRLSLCANEKDLGIACDRLNHFLKNI